MTNEDYTPGMSKDEVYRMVRARVQALRPGHSRQVIRLVTLSYLLEHHPDVVCGLFYTRSMARMHDDNADGIDPFISFGMQHYPEHVGEVPLSMVIESISCP